MNRPLAVCLSPLPWAGLWTSRHELCRELARRDWDVLFVDPPATIPRRAEPGPAAAGPPPPPGLRLMRPPPRLPYGVVGALRPASRAVITLNARAYSRAVADHLHRFYRGRAVDLLLNSFMPVLGFRVQPVIRPRASLYHRSDELRQFPGWRPLYSEIERRVAEQADLVVCVSERVKDGIRAWRPDAQVIPNGVDPEPYRGGVAPDPRLAQLPRPRSVMIANFDGRVDPALIGATASVSCLVMVGELHDTAVPPGASCLGHVGHEELPAILAGADVGVVCYRAGWAGDVLKIYEYLAAGVPVVTSHAPAAPDVRSAVTVAADAGSFASAVREAAAARTPAADAARRAVAEANSWRRRVDALLDALPAPGPVR